MNKIWTILFFVAAMNLAGCEQQGDTGAANDAPVTTYTCSMHPQIVQKKPGTCPICFMDLVLFDKTNTDPSLTLSPEQQALANVTLLDVGAQNIQDYIQLNGRLVINPEKTVYISSRAAGRVERIFVREPGVPIRKGQPLYTIYSEQLLTLQKEFIVASAQADAFPEENRFRMLADAAAQKLFLFDQSINDLKALLTTKRTNPLTEYPAPASGILASLNITEGMYVQEGSTIMLLEDYATLWVEADVYPNDAPLFRTGQTLKVSVPSMTGSFTMRVDFVQPSLLPNTQLMQIRGTIVNNGNKLQPGMQVLITATRSQKSEAIMVPADAVVRDGKTNHVWVTEDGEKFIPRKVEIGFESPTAVEITQGLSNGDKVVASGAYLLYSEYILKKGRHPVE